MTTKRVCDICGAVIPCNIIVPHNEATQMYSGTFVYSAVVVDEMDDFCDACGAKVRDYIRKLKKEIIK